MITDALAGIARSAGRVVGLLVVVPICFDLGARSNAAEPKR